MRRVALKVAYVGSDFYGFQRQPNLRTVEGEIVNALKKVGLIDEVENCGYRIAGRTDRGVHALGNVLSFLTEGDVISNQINDALPREIKILGQARVPYGFKPRFAENRHYRYLIVDQHIKNPDFDLEKMISASEIFKGTHNFKNFSKRSERNPVRTIKQVSIQKNSDLIMVDVEGESFLWNMVRKMVAVLLSIGNGDLDLKKIQDYFDPEKQVSIKPMPPEGLILMDINYSGVQFQYDSYAKKRFISSLMEKCIYHKTIAAIEENMIRILRD
jgi:tRNA pseudouridine38-40 synthase